VRDQASAVSFEEEAMDLVRFQDSYQAAARVMTVAKDMLDELLNLV
jgi:flagellar hook-associated protein 1 FlgK